MGKHLFIFILFLVSMVSCAPDQVDPEPAPKYIPYAIYELAGASFDTLAPRRVVEYQYSNGSLTAMRKRNYRGNPFDNYYQFSYDQTGNLVSLSLNGELSKYIYTYVAGKPKYGNASGRNSEFFYDGAGNLSLRIDSSGPRTSHWRADSLMFTYSDSTVRAIRVITITAPPVVGSAEESMVYFNKASRNPFDQLQTRVDFLPQEIVNTFADYMQFSKRGMIREFQARRSTNELYISTEYEVLEKKAGTNYPSLVKVTHRLYPSIDVDPTDVYFHHILYREL